MDPSKFNNHFDNTPIFGMVNNSGQGMQALETISSNPESWLNFALYRLRHDLGDGNNQR